MKRIAFFLISAIILASCSSSKETASTKAEKKVLNAEMVKHAVESRRYVIRVDKIYTQGSGPVDLIPKSNFFIMNGEIASVSLAYLGRSFYIRQITGINFNGQTLLYKMQNDSDKGVYSIQVEIKTGSDKFNFYLTIGTTGSCNLSVNNAHIQSVSYSGTLVPLSEPELVPAGKKNNI